MKRFKQFVKEQEDTAAWDREVEANKRARAVRQIGNKFSKRKETSPEDREEEEWSSNVISGKKTSEVPAVAYNRMYSSERARQNVTNRINNDIKSGEEGTTDARTGQPYVKPKPEQVPLTGRVTQAELDKQAAERAR